MPKANRSSPCCRWILRSIFLYWVVMTSLSHMFPTTTKNMATQEVFNKDQKARNPQWCPILFPKFWSHQKMIKGDVCVAFQDVSLFKVQNGNPDFGPIRKLHNSDHLIWPMNRHCCYPLYAKKQWRLGQCPESTPAFYRCSKIFLRRFATPKRSLENCFNIANVIITKGWVLMCEWLGGGFKYLFMFTPNPGEMIQFDEHILQIGWNHQLDMLKLWYSIRVRVKMDGWNTSY